MKNKPSALSGNLSVWEKKKDKTWSWSVAPACVCAARMTQFFFFFFLNCTGYKIPPTSGLSRRRIKLNVLLWRDMRARRCISIA